MVCADRKRKLTADVTAKWHRVSPAVIYSGVEIDFFPEPGVDELDRDGFAVNLIGGIYFPDRLAELFRGLQAWLDGLSAEDRTRVVIRYFGGDGQQVEAVARRHLPGLRVELAGYVPPTQLARRCRAAAINAYVMFPSLFHHKLLELLACARPVLAFGAECTESIRLAEEFGGNLIVVEDAAAVMRTIARIHGAWKLPTPSQINAERVPKFTWPQQAIALERVLAAAKRQ